MRRLSILSILVALVAVAATAQRIPTLPMNRYVIPYIYVANELPQAQYVEATGNAAVPSVGFTILRGDFVLMPPPTPGWKLLFMEYKVAEISLTQPKFLVMFNTFPNASGRGFISTDEGTVIVWYLARD